MKKIILLLLVGFCLGCEKEAASEEIVHDPINYLIMLDQTYNQLRSIENQFSSLEYLYNQVQYQIQSLKNLEFSSYESIRAYTLSRYNGIKSLNNQVRNLQLKIGEERYVLGEVLPTQEEIKEYFRQLQQAREEGDRATEEKIVNDLYEIKKINHQASLDAAAEVYALSQDTSDFYEESITRLKDLTAQVDLSESLLGQLQINNYMLANMTLYMEKIAQDTERANEMTAANQMSRLMEDYEKSIPLAPVEVPLPGLSEDFENYDPEETFFPDFSM